MYNRFVVLVLFFILSVSFIFPEESLFKKGEDYFINNQPEEAVSVLEAAIAGENVDFKAYLYLGIAYEQLGFYDKAIEVLQRGMDKKGADRGMFLLNIGNNYVRKEESKEAVAFYSKALEIDSSNTTALRNRANEYLRLKEYDKALDDYKLYLSLEPEAYQKDRIEKVIALLGNKIDEMAKQKLEEERKRLAEEKKQQELLDKVLNSLNNASEDTTNLSAGSEDVEQYSDNFDIVD